MINNHISNQIQNSLSLNNINNSINKGINFLYKNQLDYGEFKTYAGLSPWMLNSYFDSSPFVTASVLYSIKDIKNEKVRIITDKAIDFLLSEQKPGGIWRFWASKNRKHSPPDLDDISVVSFILKLKGINFDNNLQLILNNRNKDNLFLTWITNEEKDIPFGNKKEDVDCVVNTNVLLYLGENDPFICSFVNQAIKSNKPRSIYYPSKLAFFYAVSRAFQNNITCFEENKDIIIKSTLSRQKKNGSFGNNLETALALNTLFNFDYYGKEIDLGINHLLQKRSSDGSWEKAVIFTSPPFLYCHGLFSPFLYYHGSKELTTAVVIESMKNYLQVFSVRN